MDRTLVLSVGLDLDLSCRGGGLAIFSGLSEIGNLRQAKAHTTKRCSKRLKNRCKSMNESDDLAHTHF